MNPALTHRRVLLTVCLTATAAVLTYAGLRNALEPHPGVTGTGGSGAGTTVPPVQAPAPPVPQLQIRPAPEPPTAVVSVPAVPRPAAASPDLSASAQALREDVAVRMTQVRMGRTQVALLQGGLPVSRHVLWRSSVGEFVRAAGAVGGVNGTFFKDAAIASNDSNMLGPMLTPDGTFLSETDARQLKKITGRPLVAWSPTRFLVTPFVPGRMNHKAQVQATLPGVTDAFLAGAWLVHGGHALTLAEMAVHAPKDAQEVRPRVFFGVTRAGLSIAGATITPVSSVRLAEIAEAAGAQEAVLMDSGYSTSLIYRTRLLAVGHSSRKVPSRPVPHAIVFMNPLLAQVTRARAGEVRPTLAPGTALQTASGQAPAGGR